MAKIVEGSLRLELSRFLCGTGTSQSDFESVNPVNKFEIGMTLPINRELKEKSEKREKGR